MDTKASYLGLLPMFEVLNEAIIISDNEKYLWTNEVYAKLRGYDSPDELIGKSIFSEIHPDEVQENVRVIAERNRTGDKTRGIWRLRRKDGSYMPIIAHSSLLDDLDQRVTMTIVRPVDVAQGDIVPKISEAGMTHEIRSALTVIAGYIELIRVHKAVSLSPELEKWFEIIDQNLTRIAENAPKQIELV